MGSCFSNNIANKLKEYKFNIITNPFGVLYNPLSISNALTRIISGEEYTIDQIQQHNNNYFSFHHHSSFNSSEPTTTLNNINTAIKKSHRHWNNLSTLIITFGTSFIYELKSNNEVVANCHKLPGSEFNRKLISPYVIVDKFSQIIEDIKNINSKLKIILTISPVRHLRDSAHENQISKSHLFTAVNEIINTNNSIYYFPSYEIMMDELRDYRFYADDMIHPSKIAERYIYQRFSERIIEDDSNQFIQDYESILKAKKHKIKSTNPEDISKFKKNILRKINHLKDKYSKINFTDDIKLFSE